MPGEHEIIASYEYERIFFRRLVRIQEALLKLVVEPSKKYVLSYVIKQNTFKFK